MTIQASGTISLANLQTEFGGSNPVSLSEYYRGGSYTPSGYTTVPSSGAINLTSFYSTSKVASLSLSFSVSSNIVYFTATATLNLTNSSGTTLSYIIDVINSSGGNSTITINVSNGSISGSNTATTFAQVNVGSVNYVDTYLKISTLTSNTIHWPYTY